MSFSSFMLHHKINYLSPQNAIQARAQVAMCLQV